MLVGGKGNGLMVTLFRHALLQPLTIRMLVAPWAVSIMLVWSILVIGRLSTEDQFTQIGNRVVIDARSERSSRP